MHGQKKRRKRTASGEILLEGQELSWELLSEPQWSTEGKGIGLRFSVRSKSGQRALILQYPFHQSGWRPQLPQRPSFSAKTIEVDIRKAIEAGWTPDRRGKAFVFEIPESIQQEE